jgi:hypothetical protein
MAQPGPAQPVDPPIQPPQIPPGLSFEALDDELPLALLPVRLEARFLPAGAATEIVVRVFPDEIHVDSHSVGLTATERKLAARYWESIRRAAGDAAAVAEARDWLAGELGPYRALYVASATSPRGKPSRSAPRVKTPTPGRARLLPARWAAFVDVDETTAGPFWAANDVDPELAVTPALVDIPAGADAQAFLEAQGLGWAHDLDAAETAGMVIRIPISALPDRPSAGYDRLLVVGVAAGKEHGGEVGALLDAHRYTRGLDLIPPGTATNVTDQAPEAAGELDVQALFESEFPASEPRGKDSLTRGPGKPVGLMRSTPAGAVALALGLPAGTAVDRALGADDPEPELSRAANQALWPATWEAWLSEQMCWADDHTPLLGADTIAFLRGWFTDFVRAEGPLPTLRVGQNPYGLLPVSTFEHRDGGAVLDYLENTLVDLLGAWRDLDSVPCLDPDASDVAPGENAAEQASDVGAIYGAVPHVRELRLRPVVDTYRALNDLYSLRIGVVKFLCATVITDDGAPPTAEELEKSPYYQAFLEREADIRGASGLHGQIDAWAGLLDDLDAVSGPSEEETAALRVQAYIAKYVADRENDKKPPPKPPLTTGDVIEIVTGQAARVDDAQPYLALLGAHDELGAGRAPLLYTAGYGEEGTEIPVGVLVAPGTDDDAVAELSGWLADLHDAVDACNAGGPEPPYDITTPYPLLRQLLQISAARVARGAEAAALSDGLARLRDLVGEQGAAAIPVLERLLRGTLGLAMYRVDAWLTALATDRLADERVKRPAGLQVGGYGWLVDLAPRPGKASQGHIHAPSLDHATTAAVLRSGWSAFGTDEGGAPLSVDLSAPRIRAAMALVEGVRAGRELGRLLGERFERMLHDRRLDRFIDEVRAAVLDGAGQKGRPATRIVDGLLVARAYTEGVPLTDTEQQVRGKLEPIVSGEHGLAGAVNDLVGELDAVADVLFSQAVHALLRGDAGVAAPTLASTGSGDSGLPAVDFPDTYRGGRLISQRVVAVLGGPEGGAWPGASTSILAAAEPRLEAWVGEVLGPPANVLADVTSGGATRRVDLGTLGLAALDAVFGVEGLAGRLLAGEDGTIAASRPADLPVDKLSFDEFLTLARAVRGLLGRIRPLADGDLVTDPGVADSRDADELATRLAAALALVPADDPRRASLTAHEQEHPGATADLLLEGLRILTADPVPVLPLLSAGIPADLAASFAARQAASAQAQSTIAGWLAQAAKVRVDLAAFLDAVELAELASLRTHLDCTVAHSPDVGGPWAGDDSPDGTGAVTAWCNVTGAPPTGAVAGFVVDAWTETVPDVTATSGIAVHFDSPSAVAPNAVLLAVTRGGESFDLDVVCSCVRTALTMTELRALSPDTGHVFLGQFLPAAFVPDDLVVLAAESGEL